MQRTTSPKIPALFFFFFLASADPTFDALTVYKVQHCWLGWIGLWPQCKRVSLWSGVAANGWAPQGCWKSQKCSICHCPSEQTAWQNKTEGLPLLESSQFCSNSVWITLFKLRYHSPIISCYFVFSQDRKTHLIITIGKDTEMVMTLITNANGRTPCSSVCRSSP